MAAIVLSSLQACSGKSTLCEAIQAALRLHGCKVSRFSVGPGLPEQPPHAQAAGQQLPSDPAGLDGWLLSQDAVRACFHSMSSTADISLVEGCVGMFDSPAADGSEAGSTAQVAAWLHLPVVLIVDTQAFNTPRSILALVRGYAAEDGSASVAGLILNKTQKQSLAAETQDALRQAGLDIAVLGGLPLVQAATAAVQGGSSQQLQQQELLPERVTQLVCDTLDLQLLRQLAAAAAVPQPQVPLPPAARTFRVSLGVAYDEAFYRYFQENLHLLQLAGVQLVPFSPLHDKQLPPGLSGVLLGGGSVAQHAAQLSANSPMLGALRAFAGAGGLVIGEAGGLLYLSQSLQWQQHGQRHAMVGLFSFHTQATPHKGPHNPSYVSLTVNQQAQHPLLIPGSRMRGLATCCCQVLEERPVGSLAAALAAATDATAPQQQQRGSAANQGRVSSGSGGGSSSSDGGSTAADGPQQQQQQQPEFRGASDYTYSYSCTPLAASSKGAAATVAPADVGAIEEGYTRGTVLASAVQVHYGSCPELAQHMAQRCLRVDVATVTAAAKSAAAAAAAASTGVSRQPPASLLLPDACESHDSNDTHGSLDAADFRLPSPGSRALSAPNLQDMVWHQLRSGSTPPAAGLTAAAAAAVGAAVPTTAATPPAGNCSSSSSSVGGAWFCPANDPAAAAAAQGEEVPSAAAVGPGGPMSPARKSSSVPSEMWQMAGAEQRQQQHHQYLPYARYQQQLQQLPLGFRVGSCPSGAQALVQGQAGTGAGPSGMLRQGPASEHGGGGQQQQPGQQRWGAPAFNVPKRWSMELQRLGSSLTSQLLQGGGYRSDPGSPRSVAAAAAQQQQQQSQSHAQSQQQQQQRGHSRNNSRSMMHLPEEAPLSEAAIRILDSSLPALLGRTHHTHIGVAVPLSGAGSAAASAACSTGGTGTAGSVGLQTGGTLDSMSRSSSVHEQMSNLAASLALQEAAGKLASSSATQGQPLLSAPPATPGSCTDHESICTSACPELITPDQQLMLQQVQGWGLGQRLSAQQQQQFSLEALTAAHQQSQQQPAAATARSRSSSSRLSSVDTPTAFAAATAALDDKFDASMRQQEQQQQGPVGPHDSVTLLQPEVSLKAGLGASGHHHHQQQQQLGPRVASLGALAAAGAAAATAAGAGLKLPPKKASTSSSSLSGMWAGGGTPKAAAAAAVAAAAAGAAAQGSGLGSIMSLSPAATDILIALGLYQRVKGVTDACRPCTHASGSSGGGSGAGGGSSSSASASSSCWQVLQLLEAMGAPWVTEAVEAATGSSRGPDVVCRLVAGADGLPRYKLDEDCIRSLQPSLVVVACDENSGEEPHCQHHQQLQKARGGAAVAAGAAAAAAAHGVGSSGASGSAVTAAVAVPGRVRLEPHVVQRVLQRAGVWGEGRAVVLYQRCHSLAEVLEFMQVLAQAAGVPERGALLVEGLRARLRATAGRVCLAGEALASSAAAAPGGGVLTPSGSRRGGRSAASAGGVECEAGAAGTVVGGGGSCVARPSVMVLGCTAPLSLVGFWVPEMLQLLRLEPATLGPAPGEAPVELTWAQLRETEPDVLVLALPGLPAAQAALQLADLASLPRFWAMPAVRAGAVYAVDHALLLRPGPGLVLGLELLSHLAAPEQQPLPAGLPLGSVLKLSLHGGQRCRPRLVPHYMARYC